MNKPIKWIMNSMPPSEDKWLDVMSTQEIEKVRAFHRSFPQYAPTPLANLRCAAEALGLGGLAVKDEISNNRLIEAIREEMICAENR